jgi:hypothetical protein
VLHLKVLLIQLTDPVVPPTGVSEQSVLYLGLFPSFALLFAVSKDEATPAQNFQTYKITMVWVVNLIILPQHNIDIISTQVHQSIQYDTALFPTLHLEGYFILYFYFQLALFLR